MRRYLRLLRRRDYALLWWGATISALGDGMSFVALLWLALEQSRDAGVVGLLAAAYTAPVVVGGLAAGVVLDRWNRRRVLIIDNLVRGLAIATIPVAAALDALTVPHLFVVAAIYGLLFMLSLAGIPSVLPTLVDPDELTTANAMESVSFGIAGMVGPVMAGAIIAIVGAPIVLALDAASYGVFVACLFFLHETPARPEGRQAAGAGLPAGEHPAAAERGGSGLLPAIRFVLDTPAVLTITVMYMAINIAQGMWTVLAPVYARDVLGGDASTYGLIVSAFGAGSLVGTIAVGGIGWPFALGRSIAVATLLTGLVFVPMLVLPPLAPSVAIMFLTGLFASSLTPWAQTIRMRLIPPGLRGRVFALLRTLMQGTTPVGAVIGGAMLAGGAVQPVIAVAIVIIIVPGLVGMFTSALGAEATLEPRRAPPAA